MDGPACENTDTRVVAEYRPNPHVGSSVFILNDTAVHDVEERKPAEPESGARLCAPVPSKTVAYIADEEGVEVELADCAGVKVWLLLLDCEGEPVSV